MCGHVCFCKTKSTTSDDLPAFSRVVPFHRGEVSATSNRAFSATKTTNGEPG